MSETEIYILISAVLGFLVGFFAEFLLGVLQTHYDEYRDRVVQKRVSRGDLRAKMRNFRDTWEDRDCIIPATDMRKDLIRVMRDIRESINDEIAQLHEDEKTAIRKVTNAFLTAAGKFPDAGDAIWSQKVKTEMEKTCKDVEEILKKLA
jgi:gas vesicle protein